MRELSLPYSLVEEAENAGNRVYPAAFDLGEHFKVALLYSKS